ncbi:capsular biosynthesis protein [Prevotella sp. HMSC073D09]|jgi:putative capsular polysaccharide biosynthesis protein|uniref:EpsG family protein n=1 Tax=Prevotella sp. HMSC073D09 TaxID=1739459 RepID=UPI0008A57CA2|nr:EpsG family protein [Prevotella sp. HMSC073D09]OFQ10405.1 capsular biosynthesis protein [Prevotella sp. HMSC073D09]
MYIYILILALAMSGVLFLPQKSAKSTIYLACWMIGLALFVGFSDMLGGYDRYIYGELFDEVADIRQEGRDVFTAYIFQQYPTELGYVYLNMLLSYFTSNRYVFILVVTLIIYALYYINIKRYASDYRIALLLFFGLLFFFTFTYLRQMIGVGIAGLSLKYVYERKLWKFVVLVLLATSFHNSAVILLPVYFIPVRKYSISSVLVIMFVCLLVGVSGASSTLFEAYSSTSGLEERAAGYVEDTSGFRVAYLLEAVFFLWLILGNYEKLGQDKKQIILLNNALIFCGILLLFIRSENGGRLGWFFIITLISTLTTIFSQSFSKEILNRIIVYFVVLFLYFRIVIAWGVLLSPYKTFFTDGVREGDFIYERYEYDTNYAKDKFYK